MRAKGDLDDSREMDYSEREHRAIEHPQPTSPLTIMLL
jgi:hypothetical protein